MIRFPYGIADFQSIRRQGMFYLDRTSGIRRRTTGRESLLVRPEMRRLGFFDVLFELKLVRRAELGKTGEELRAMADGELRELTPIARALAAARDQVLGYRDALVKRFGEARPRCYVVVAAAFERLLGDEVA
jgi:hypothetical protein